MTETEPFKVLWVEDQTDVIEANQGIADLRNIEFDTASSWEEAEDKLRINFNEYSAIILDAFCKIKKEDSIDSEIFLGYVSVRLSRIFGERHKFIPWYVLSAGTMKNFDIVLQLINSEERQRFDSDWGPMKYLKGGKRKLPESDEEVDDEDYLFDNISKIARQFGTNAVLFRHSKVFKYIGEGRIFNDVESRRYILKMLSALYYPDENLNFEYKGNSLRKVVEHLFRTANNYGLLPDELFKGIDNDKQVVLQLSSLYLSGNDVRLNDGRIIRYGNPNSGKDKHDGDTVFDYDTAKLVKYILRFVNKDSHTNENNPYVNEENKKEIFFGYALQLCHVIKWFGDYIEKHSDVEKNKSMIRITKSDDKYSNKSKTVEKQTDIPSAASLLDSTAYIMMSGKAGKLTCGPYCRIDYNYSSDIGKKAKIRKIAINEGSDANEYPYIATEIKLITDNKE